MNLSLNLNLNLKWECFLSLLGWVNEGSVREADCRQHKHQHCFQWDVWTDEEDECNSTTLPHLELCKCSFLHFPRKQQIRVGLQIQVVLILKFMNNRTYKGERLGKKCGEIDTVSSLKNIPIRALSCVLKTPSPIPNRAAIMRRFMVPSIPLDGLHDHNKVK